MSYSDYPSNESFSSDYNYLTNENMEFKASFVSMLYRFKRNAKNVTFKKKLIELTKSALEDDKINLNIELFGYFIQILNCEDADEEIQILFLQLLFQLIRSYNTLLDSEEINVIMEIIQKSQNISVILEASKIIVHLKNCSKSNMNTIKKKLNNMSTEYSDLVEDENEKNKILQKIEENEKFWEEKKIDSQLEQICRDSNVDYADLTVKIKDVLQKATYEIYEKKFDSYAVQLIRRLQNELDSFSNKKTDDNYRNYVKHLVLFISKYVTYDNDEHNVADKIMETITPFLGYSDIDDSMKGDICEIRHHFYNIICKTNGRISDKDGLRQLLIKELSSAKFLYDGDEENLKEILINLTFDLLNDEDWLQSTSFIEDLKSVNAKSVQTMDKLCVLLIDKLEKIGKYYGEMKENYNYMKFLLSILSSIENLSLIDPKWDLFYEVVIPILKNQMDSNYRDIDLMKISILAILDKVIKNIPNDKINYKFLSGILKIPKLGIFPNLTIFVDKNSQ